MLEAGANCRALYQQIERATRDAGLDAEQVELSAGRYRERKGGRDLVTRDAYAPTGAALGCPLPDDDVARMLSAVAEEIERFLRRTRPYASAWFSYVPTESYHVTVVNRGHFDTSEVQDIDAPTRERLADVVWHRPPIAIELDGIVITKQGRVLAKGIPCSDDLASLRQLVVTEIPELAENTPRTAHIKLGHVLVPLTPLETAELIAFAKSFDPAVQGSLVFYDLFTPAGRVALRSS